MNLTAQHTLIKQTAQVALPDGKTFTYTIKPFDLVNSLGNGAASLHEYCFHSTQTGENYKLYRTAERSWYDIEEPVTDTDKSNVRLLKSAIDAKEHYSFLE